MKKALVLLSGGLDSAANLALSQMDVKGFSQKSDVQAALALTVDYGQQSAIREIENAKKLTEHFGVEHIVYDLRSFVNLIGAQSALFGKSELPQPEDEKALDDFSKAQSSAQKVWVPNRNAILLSLAGALAESRGLDAILVGFNLEEAMTFPDNSFEFMTAMTHCFSFSTANQVQVLSQTVGFNKIEIVERLERADFPFEYLWSCYRAGSVHCGKCESCQRLHRALMRGMLDSEQKRKALESVFGW